MRILGVDVGGSGIKGAIVDTATGEMLTERHRIPTPQPATPQAVADTIKQLVTHFQWKGPIGCGFPAAIQHGVAKTAANVDDAFIDTHIEKLFAATTGCDVYCVNDADAAGMAEFKLGKGQEHKQGIVIFVAVGTGLGTAVFTNGELLPNTELGHIYLDNGHEAERYAADSARKREDLKWKQWAPRFNHYLTTMEALFWPDLIILGGGASKKMEKFESLLTLKTPVVAATLLNEAGIIGAAVYAETERKRQQAIARKIRLATRHNAL
ncbi:polyphosphate--glucose phosphotransferase [Planctobacterium marinum]|uniref:polyphosphate--glucose phosphotransferase n=1 Tax=Planctobacterium marinum TaxID=1631968 RepID=UPI001E63B79E|nr:ROK family protein [Planctobacterium marinum]MCC2605433.1 ROK family protein [Planctobacterium marinum]